NVHLLREAWVYHTGDSGEMQCNPLMIGGKLYGITTSNHLFALNAATGEELWRFMPDASARRHNSRGLAYWKKGEDKRLFFVSGSDLYAVDAETGKAIETFGDSARVSLRTGLREDAADK